MLTGHIHKTFILKHGDEKNTIDHSYPVIVGSSFTERSMVGTAIELYNGMVKIKFTNSAKKVLYYEEIKIRTD